MGEVVRLRRWKRRVFSALVSVAVSLALVSSVGFTTEEHNSGSGSDTKPAAAANGPEIRDCKKEFPSDGWQDKFRRDDCEKGNQRRREQWAADSGSGGGGGDNANDSAICKKSCIHPNMSAFNAKATKAGFHKPSSCWRPYHAEKDRHEHPRGRGCDWIFANPENSVANGEEKTYGDSFVTWAIANAGDLKILYIIWFERDWTPEDGWTPYKAAANSSSPYIDHTNHVHISVES